nr:MAG TPA: SOS-response transcriptional repressor [Caudoviricetes sp.]
MDMSTEIKVMLTRSGKTQIELAEMLGTSQGNLGNKLKRNKWTVNEVEDIADKLGFKMNISFTEKAAE